MRRPPARSWLPPLGLVAAVILAYLPAIHGAYIWDDARYVTENPVLRAPGGLLRIWTDIGATIQYYPMVFTTFWLEHHFWGLTPLGYHLVNVLLHAASAVLLGLALRRLRVPGAWLGAAFFALHPLEVESVAWITERKNVLSGVFYLAAALAYLRWAAIGGAAVRHPDTASDEAAGGGAPRRAGPYALVLLLFLLALLSKTVTGTLPAVLLLVVWWQRGRLARRDLWPLVPMLALGAGMGLLTAWIEKHHVHAQGPDWALGFGERLLIAGRALWFYLGKLVLPLGLSFNYPRWQLDPQAWWQVLAPAAFAALLLLLWLQRRHLGRGPLVAMLAYAGTLFPALGFIDLYPMRYSFVADHFQYLAGIAPLALAAALLARTARPAPVRRTLATLLLLALGLVTWRQSHAYHDRATLWHDTLRKNPASFLAHCNLGILLLEEGHAEAARAHLAEAVRLKPDMHEAHASLGQALVDLGQIDEGLEHYREAIRLKPGMAWAYQALGNALAAQGKTEEAIARLEQALRLRPDFVEVSYNLANLLAASGKPEQALGHYRRALELAPGEARIHHNLANALAELGRLDAAADHYRTALRLQPDNGLAHRNLGIALARRGDLDDAIQELWLALRANRGDVAAHFYLAETLRRTGRRAGALEEYRRTLDLDPQHAAARRALATMQEPQTPPPPGAGP